MTLPPLSLVHGHIHTEYLGHGVAIQILVPDRRLADVDGELGREYRVELVDQHGKTLAVKPVEGA